eukprot:jgi/Chlat1/3730/Chrsp259S03882
MGMTEAAPAVSPPMEDEKESVSLGYISSIPVVDLALPRDAAVAALRSACEEYGFFYLTNHGVDVSLIEAVYAHARAFFALPLETKMRTLADANNRGYTPVREETLDPANSSQGDSKEGYYIGKEVAAGSEQAQKPLHGPNQWPDSELLPGWREIMEEYLHQIRELGMRVTRLIGEALGLQDGFFDQPGRFDDPMVFIRLLRYAPEPSRPDEGVYAAGAHSDYGMLTLLSTDNKPGLQINLRDKQTGQLTGWIEVPPKPEAFIVNLGDMLERWSNDSFRSTLHRVINTQGCERFSIPFFFEPNFDCVVECLGECCKDRPPRYPPTTSGQHLLDMYKATHAGYAAMNADPIEQPS